MKRGQPPTARRAPEASSFTTVEFRYHLVRELQQSFLSHTCVGEYTATISAPPDRTVEDLEDLKDVVRDEIVTVSGFESWGVT